MAVKNFTGYGNQKIINELYCSAELNGRAHNHLIFLLVLDICLSITAFLGNSLILVALRKESSLHPPSKLLYRSLATTDLCVGMIVDPLVVTRLIAVMNQQWNICRYAVDSIFISGYILFSVSLLTLTAISVDRLLALLLGLRYRQVVTLKRTYLAVIVFWVVSIVGTTTYLLGSTYNFLVWQHRYSAVSSHLSFLLHKNVSYLAPQPSSSTEPRFRRATEPSNSTEHSSIQKGSVQCTVGAGNVSSLLFAVWYSINFDASKRDLFIRLPC